MSTKTKIVVFRNAGKVRYEETWSFDGKIIEVVYQFTYLGNFWIIIVNFLLLKKQIASQGRKGMFALKS